MTWSGFRPSDDTCCFGYLIPSNMMAVQALGFGAEICRECYGDEALREGLNRMERFLKTL